MSSLDEEETFSELAFVQLNQTDLSIRATKKQLIFQKPTMQQYNERYWMWKHGYRKRYSKKFLARYGFEGESDGNSNGVDDAKLTSYMQSVDPLFDYAIGASTSLATPEDMMHYHLQNSGSSWSNRDKILDGNRHLDYTSFKENGDPWEPNHHLHVVGRFTPVGGGAMTSIEITNLYGSNAVFKVQYKRTGAEETEWFLHLAYASSVPQGTTTTGALTLTPIIPLKEQGVVVPETKGMKKMLRKLNVDADAFEEMLYETDEQGEASIDNAYLMSALPMINPYEIFPKVYVGKEAEALPYALLKEAETQQINPYGVSGHTEGLTQEVNIYTITPKMSEDWYMDHLREQAYLARALFKTFAYYCGEFSPECEDIKNTGPRYLGKCVNDFEGSVGPGKPPLEDGFSLHDLADRASNYGGFEVHKGSMSMIYNFSVSVKTYGGRVRPDIKDKRSQGSFRYTGPMQTAKDKDGEREIYYMWTEEGSNIAELRIQVQIDETSYQEMVVTDYSNFIVVHGIAGSVTPAISVGMPFPAQENRLIIPYFVLYGVRFTEFVTVYEHSLCLMAYAQKVVVVKFWKKIIGVIIAAVICYFSSGTGCTFGVFIYQLIVGYLIGMLIQHIISMIDSEILKFVVQIIGWLIQLWMGGFDFSAMTTEVWLKLAVQVGTMAVKAYEAHEIKAAAGAEADRQAQERIEEKMSYGDSMMSVSPALDMSAHYSFTENISADAYINEALGSKLYNYDQYYDVDGEYELRKNVKSG